MKNGIIIENGVPVYYEDGKPIHKGIVEDGEAIYYFGKGGKAVSGKKYVHNGMTHHIVKHGTYKFGKDYKMMPGYYKPASEQRNIFKTLKKKLKTASHKARRKTKKARKKDILRVLIPLGAALIIALVVIELPSIFRSSGNAESTGKPFVSGRFSVNIPEMDGEIWLVTSAGVHIYTEGADVISATAGSLYKPLAFDYSISYPGDVHPEDIVALLYLDEGQSMAHAVRYELDPSRNQILIDNLKVDTTYYYRVEVSLEKETHTVDGSFKTAASHRILSLPNAVNVRDVGGRKTMDGKTIKQNMIIRGSELDGLARNSYFLLDDTIEYARSTFGFASDLDLRERAIGYSGYASQLGLDVKHEFFDAPSYAGVVSKANLPTVKRIFSFLADKSNYPIYMHCTAGVDRTGTFVYLLDAILGLSEEEMNMEYQLSHADINNFAPLKAVLRSYEGYTINEKVEHFLIESAGVTPAEIAAIREIMLEG